MNSNCTKYSTVIFKVTVDYVMHTQCTFTHDVNLFFLLVKIFLCEEHSIMLLWPIIFVILRSCTIIIHFEHLLLPAEGSAAPCYSPRLFL